MESSSLLAAVRGVAAAALTMLRVSHPPAGKRAQPGTTAPVCAYPDREESMRLLYDYLFQALWIVFLLYWNLMAINAKVTKRLEPAGSRIARALMFLAAIVLFSVPLRSAWLNLQLWPAARFTFFAGIGLTLAGMLLCVWARLHLGRNWSRSVTIKQSHELIVTGPYALVRHPIYTGLLTAMAGAVLAGGEIRGLIAFSLIAASLWYKLRLEEKWMREQFGAAYAAYSGRVSALVPFVI
jgi:protein-S-isoprenylcysteine O-methyltransferase Ste14